LFGSPSDFSKAAGQSLGFQAEISRRHATLDSQLESRGLTAAVDVIGDGNCFFRAASLIIHGNESQHVQLRAEIASHIENSGVILDGVVVTSPDDNNSFSKHVESMRTNGTSVGEDAVLALATVYKRDVIVHTAGVEPLCYKSNNAAINHPAIQLAFYEPGHYKAVDRLSAVNPPAYLDTARM